MGRIYSRGKVVLKTVESVLGPKGRTTDFSMRLSTAHSTKGTGFPNFGSYTRFLTVIKLTLTYRKPKCMVLCIYRDYLC